jgi:hypothetical protein
VQGQVWSCDPALLNSGANAPVANVHIIQNHVPEMKTTKYYVLLIRVIEGIYFKVTLSLLHKRMDGYHQQSCRGIKPYAGDIKEPLQECIDTIVFHGLNQTGDSKLIHELDTANQHIPEKYNVEELHQLNKERVAELAHYFKSRRSEFVLNAGIEEKLEHSTWEHIHAVVRCAKQGDDHGARMHADIASTACQELAHFMLEKNYTDFIGEIETYLDVLKTRQ